MEKKALLPLYDKPPCWFSEGKQMQAGSLYGKMLLLRAKSIPSMIKCTSYGVILACWWILAGCTPGAAGGEADGQISAGPDSVGILDYVSSGRLDKAIPAVETATSGSITIAVDESLRPVVEAEIEAFQFLYPEARIEARYLPGEEAIALMLASDSVRLAIACRQLEPEEEALLAKRSISPKYAHVFTDGICLITHPDVQVARLRLSQFEQILRGTIRTWRDLDPSLPATPVQLVFDNRASHLLTSLRKTYLGGEPLPGQQVFALNNTTELLDHVKTHPGSLGFVGAAWISDLDDPRVVARREGLAFVAMEKGPGADSTCAFNENFFLPFQSYIYAGCYSLPRPVFTILRESTHGLGTGFVSFVDGPKGQAVIHKAGLATVHGVGRTIKLPPKDQSQLSSSNSQLR